MTTKDISNLIHDIHGYLNGDHSTYSVETGELSGSTAKHTLTLAKNLAFHTLDLANHRPPSPKPPSERTIRMSELGEPCLRKLVYYKWHAPHLGLPPFSDPPNPTLPLKFLLGDYVEEIALYVASESGHEVKDRQKEVFLRPSIGEWYAVGHIDATIDDVVVDVKSAADVSFQKYKREGLTEDNDTFGYRYQIDAYAQALGIDQRAFLFVNKHDGEMLLIDRTGESWVNVHMRIMDIGNATSQYRDHGTQPDRRATKLDKYGDKLDTVCSYCNFKHDCWDNKLVGFIASGRPNWYVSLNEQGEKFAKDKAKIQNPIPF